MRTKTSAPYRTPDVPSGLGGYHWPTAVGGLFALVVWNAVATQWIAQKFAYARALGEPYLTMHGYSFYQPFAWAWWMLRYSKSANLVVRNTVLGGAGIVVLGCAATMMAIAVLNIRRTRNIMKGNEDLRGSARWATKADILKDTSLLTTSDGVYTGGFRDGNHLHYLMHAGKEHVLAFAPTRSGKGIGLVIPTLLAWPYSCVVYDIKGENWALTAGFRAKALKQYCFKFSPLERDGSRFNPLAEIRLGTDRELSDAQNIAEMIMTTGDTLPEDNHFVAEATSLTVGLILHICYAAKCDNPHGEATIADLLHLYTDPKQPFIDTLNEILKYPHMPEGFTAKPGEFNPFEDRGGSSQTHPKVAAKVRGMLNKADKEFSGVLSSGTRALSVFADPLVDRSTSASDFRIQDLVNSDRPCSLYIIIPPPDRQRLRPLVRLLFTMITNRLMEKMDFGGVGNALKKNKHRMLFLIDEFPSLGKLQSFADALSFMAGYGLKAYLIAQDVRQIVESYGENESIVSNCHVRIAYAPNNEETAELLSRMTGNQTIQKANISFSGGRAAPVQQQMSTSVEYVERALLTPDEVKRMKAPEKSGRGDSEKITGPGDMLIFSAGARPIYGTQILYFKDPELLKRSQIPPPTTFPILRKSVPVSIETLTPQGPSKTLPENKRTLNPIPEPTNGTTAFHNATMTPTTDGLTHDQAIEIATKESDGSTCIPALPQEPAPVVDAVTMLTDDERDEGGDAEWTPPAAEYSDPESNNIEIN
jgi:type IV secretion system protein VirD4